jgi:hypothetical protein
VVPPLVTPPPVVAPLLTPPGVVTPVVAPDSVPATFLQGASVLRDASGPSVSPTLAAMAELPATGDETMALLTRAPLVVTDQHASEAATTSSARNTGTTHAASTLPRTGSSTATMAIFATLTILLGALAVRASGRRARTTDRA